MEDARTYRQLTQAETHQLLAKARQGNQWARDELIEQHKLFVPWAVNRLPHMPLSYEDAVGYGHIGLIRAVDNFREGRGAKFTTFAHFCIRLEVQRARIQESPLSSHTLQSLVKMQDAQNELMHTLGREPSLGEIAQRLRVQEKTVEDWVKLSERATTESLDAARPGCEDLTLHDILTDPKAQEAFEDIDNLDLVTDLRGNHTTEKKRRSMDLMKDNPDMTQAQLARALDVNQATISRWKAQLGKQAINLHQHNTTTEEK